MTTIVAANDVAAAERRAERIRLRLDSIADNIDAVLPMIREAIHKGDAETLGYNGVSDYVQDRFGGALTRLPVDLRRPVVHELASAGMSTRAIAPVVGVHRETVAADLRGGRNLPPAVDIETGEVSDNFPAPEVLPAGKGGAAVTPPTEARVETPTPRASVTGLDGKNYTRPEPKAPKRKPYLDDLAGVVHVLSGAAEKLHALMCDSRFTQNSEKAAAENRDDLLRIISVLQDATQRMS